MRSLILVLVTIYVFDFEDRKKIDPSLQIIFRKIQKNIVIYQYAYNFFLLVEKFEEKRKKKKRTYFGLKHGMCFVNL